MNIPSVIAGVLKTNTLPWKQAKYVQYQANKITSPDAILFLWATTPMLKHGLEVMDAWGFEYRTSMVWVKPLLGLDNGLDKDMNIY